MLAVIPYPGLELLSTAVLMLDEELNVTYANPAAETLFAHGRKHLIGAPIDRALPTGADFVARLRSQLANLGVCRRWRRQLEANPVRVK